MAPADRRVAKPATVPVRDWLGRYCKAAKAERIKPAYEGMVRLAAHLALVGDCNDADAQALFWVLKALFFHEKRIGRWAAALDVLPSTREGMLRILQCVQHYRAVVESAEQPEKALFKLDEVVAVMVAVEDPAGYVQVTKDLRRIGSVFHPNTLAHARKKLRGTMGELADMAARHAAHTSKKIQVIRV